MNTHMQQTKKRTLAVYYLVLCAAALVCMTKAPSAHAFTVLTLDNGRTVVRWPGGAMSFEINTSLIPYLSDDIDAVLAGFAAWEQLTCAQVTLSDEGLTQAQGASYTGGFDGVNRVVFVEAQNWRAEDSSALAVTTFDFTGTGLGEADISYNGSYRWSTTGEGGKYDVQGVGTHEIGHYFGILHSDEAAATMFPSTGAAELGPRTLAPDDQQAFCFLYPAGGTYTCDDQNACPQINYYDQFGRDRALGQMRCVEGVCKLGDQSVEGGFGDLCEDSTQCADELICAENAGERRCTQNCTLGQVGGCPQDAQCVTFSFVSDEGVCWPEGQGTKVLGDECLFSSECIDGLCVLNPSKREEGVGLCSRLCREGVGSCPDETLCLPIPIPGRSACLPTGDGTPGTPCASFIDCEGGLCLRDGDGVSACRAACDADALPDLCASGSACLRSLYGDACLPVGESAPGVACNAPFDCDSLLCLPDTSPGAPQGASVCSRRCDRDAAPCPEGLTCQFFGVGQEFCVADSTPPADTNTDTTNDTTSTADTSSDTANAADTANTSTPNTDPDDGCGCQHIARTPAAPKGYTWALFALGACALWGAARTRRRPT